MSKKTIKKYKITAVSRLLSYVVGRSKFIFIAACVCVLISTAANVSGSAFIQVLIDKYIAPLLLAENPVFDGLAKVLALMGAVYLTGVLCTLTYSRLMVKVSQGSLKSIRDDMFNRMQYLPIRYFDSHTHGDVMSRYTNDTDTLRQFISQAMPQLFSCIVTIIASFSVMMYYSVALSLVVVSVTALMVAITKKVAGKSTRYFIRQQTALGDINGYIEENLVGWKVVKVFCHEEASKCDFVKKNDKLYEDSKMANKYANVLMPILGQIGNLQYVILAFVGGYMTINGIGGATPGIVVAFLSLSKSFSMPVMQISQQISMVAMALAGAERIFNLIDEKPESDDGYVTLVRAKEAKEKNEDKKENGEIVETSEETGFYAWKHPHGDGRITYTRLNGNILMEDVDFGYDPKKIVLHNVSLCAESGRKIAFVGSTGAGKTTITNLINRFYDIADGKIRYDGININKIKKSDLRRSLGMVLQDTYLFTGTIMENIRYGRLNATDDECIEAAKLANAHDFISRLPMGYQTMLVGAGAGLSQGERQLIAIARAAVANPPAMILDEATSSIDTRTEKLVQIGMDGLMKGRTTFVIAHRLSTIRNADTIMVLDNGRIIESGSHDSLIEKRGVYYQLYTGAFELE